MNKFIFISILFLALTNKVLANPILQARTGILIDYHSDEILFELDWVKPAGRKDVPGKPIQYATTETFLNHFNIQKLSDLPTIDELGSAGLIDTSAIDKSIFGTGKFFKEQAISDKQNNIYVDIDQAIKKAPDEEK